MTRGTWDPSVESEREWQVGTVAAEAVGTRRDVPLWAEVTLRGGSGPALALSVTWTAAFRRDTSSGFYMGGAMSGTVAEWCAAGHVKGRDGWTAGRVAVLAAVGERWHLNDLLAGCWHQRLLGWSYDANRDREAGAYAGAACPECGYRIGHAWRFEQLPLEVVAYLRALPDQLQTGDGERAAIGRASEAYAAAVAGALCDA